MTCQPELPIIAPPADADAPLVPVCMVNEHVYCPRLAYLMWVEKEWAGTPDTVDGKRVHTQADRPASNLPADETGLSVSSDCLDPFFGPPRHYRQA